jgi:hypothetical protein
MKSQLKSLSDLGELSSDLKRTEIAAKRKMKQQMTLLMWMWMSDVLM